MEVARLEKEKTLQRKNASHAPSASINLTLANLSATIVQPDFHKIKILRRCAFPVFLAPTNLAQGKQHAHSAKLATIPKTRNNKTVKSAPLDGRRPIILGLLPVCHVHPVRTPTMMAPLYAKIALVVDLIRAQQKPCANQ